ncbi:MAG TPA: alpha/beta hydrolase [Gaiellaceae bacterium]|nr:alpha/beta hydrolase [Gaiellaceae bacterium]
MAFARNALDGSRVYFEGDGDKGAALVLHGGFGESVDVVRGSPIAQGIPADEFRHIYVDHRGHGRSDKPHNPAAYSMPLRVADALAVLDQLGIDRAHFVGLSWGGRLCFGIGEHAPERVSSLIIGGQQPYRWPDSPLTRVVTEALEAAQTHGMEAFAQALEDFWGIRLPEPQRTHGLDNDPVALRAAWRAALSEGAISGDLGAWQLQCLIFIGAADADFHDGALRAASEIPDAEFIALDELNHYGAHTNPEGVVLDAILRVLRGG